MPSTVRTDGTCPSCGQLVDAGRARTPGAPRRNDPAQGDDPSGPEKAPPAPWHLKLLLIAVAIYLSYRLFQGVAWVVAHV